MADGELNFKVLTDFSDSKKETKDFLREVSDEVQKMESAVGGIDLSGGIDSLRSQLSKAKDDLDELYRTRQKLDWGSSKVQTPEELSLSEKLKTQIDAKQNEIFDLQDAIHKITVEEGEAQQQATQMGEKIKEAADEGKAAASSINLSGGVESLQQKLEQTKESLKSLKDEYEQLNFKGLTEGRTDEEEARFKELYDLIPKTTEQIRELETEIANAGQGGADAEKQLSDADNQTKQSSEEAKASISETASLIDRLLQGNVDLMQAYDMGKSVKGSSDEIKAKITEATDALRNLQAAYQETKKEIASEGGMKNASDGEKQNLTELQGQIQVTRQYLSGLKDSYKEVVQEEKNHESALVRLLGGTESYNEIISQMPSSLQSAAKGINGMAKAGKAFIATPLGAVLAAIILALKTVKTWFDSTAEGQMAFARISGYVSGVLGQLKEVVIAVGRAIYNAFTNPQKAVEDLWQAIKTNIVNRFKGIGDMAASLGKILKAAFTLDIDGIKAGVKELGESFLQVGTGVDNLPDKVGKWTKKVSDAAKATSDIAAANKQLERDQAEWDKKSAEYDKKIAEARNNMMYSKDSKEQKKASEEYTRLLKEQEDGELSLIDRRIALQKQSMALTSNTIEDENKLTELEKQRVQIQTKGVNRQRMAMRAGNSIERNETSQENKEATKRKKREEAEAKYNLELSKLAHEGEEAKTAAKTAAMEEGYAKEKAELDNEHSKRLADITDWATKEKNAIKAKGLSKKDTEALYGQVDEIAKAKVDNEKTNYDSKTAKLEKERQEELTQNRLDYLKEYGTFKEKEAAITEEYDRKIAKATDEYEKKTLEAEKNNSLYELEKQYSAVYDLIFRSAESMSDNMLAKAIEYTQEEIKKAADSGDVQKLTELYDKLREKQAEKSGRETGWGFSGLAEGLRMLSDARKREEDAEYEMGRGNAETAKAFMQEAQDFSEKGMSKIQQGLSQITSSLGEIGDALSSFPGVLGKIGGVISGLASNASEVAETLTQAFSKDGLKGGAAWSAAISGTMQVVSMVGSQIAKNKEAQEEWAKAVRETAYQYTLLKLDELDYQQRNIFGVESPYKKAIDSAYQYREAMGDLVDLQSKLAAGKVQTGTKKVASGKNTASGAASGAAAGAAIGSVVPAIGTAIGTAAGAVAGALAGLFGGKKKVKVYSDLIDKFGWLYDKEMNLNPEIVASYSKLDDETKEVVDNWDEIKNKAEEAKKQMEETFTSLSGDIGTQLSDTLVEAFRNGKLYDSIDDFHDYINGKIEDILAQKAFASVFGNMFDELEDRMNESFSEGGDESITDDLDWFADNYAKRLGQYDEAMKDVQKQMNKMGYADAFKSTSDRTGSSKGLAQASQDSIDELNGRFTVIQSHTFEINENVRSIQALNTMLTDKVSSILLVLTGVHDDTSGMRGDIASLKTAVQDMRDKGVKVMMS